jgi:electron transfer flavoprotein alpha subunit
MGPPRAEEVLRDAISRGAQRGLLLCDRAFAGSDTWATANALAAAITYIGGVDLVLTGLSAIDGETGQVGPQVAARLGLPQATGCEALDVDGAYLDARRIVEGGFERLRVPLPALVTVAETGFVPRYPTLPGRRRAAHADIERVTAADLGVPSDRVGLNASPTKVAHMAPAALPDRGCRMVGDGFDVDALVAELADRGALRPAVSDRAALPTVPIEDTVIFHEPVEGSPMIWVVCEGDADDLSRASAELLTKAVELAPALGGGVGAFCAERSPDAMARAAARFGADAVYVARDPELSPYRCLPHARVLADALAMHRPAAVLFAATTTGRELAPRVAARLDTGLAADCTDLEVGPWERRHVRYEALLHQIRPSMAGGVVATCVSPVARPQMATVRPGVFEPAPHPRRAREIEVPVAFQPGDLDVTVLDRGVERGSVSLVDAEAIVAGGAGCDAQSWHLVEELAEAIGGRVAASRGAVEAGLAPRSAQVGQTGATVHPALYVACGVSGALQHVVGMRTASTIVAVNRDPDAFIFRLADFGVVGEVAEVLPALAEAVRRAQPS